MKLILALLMLVITTGCTVPLYDIKTDRVVVVIDLVDETIVPGAYGTARWSSSHDFCRVQIRKDVYPACITHEIRHCFEGQFHPGRHSVVDCFNR